MNFVQTNKQRCRSEWRILNNKIVECLLDRVFRTICGFEPARFTCCLRTNICFCLNTLRRPMTAFTYLSCSFMRKIPKMVIDDWRRSQQFSVCQWLLQSLTAFSVFWHCHQWWEPPQLRWSTTPINCWRIPLIVMPFAICYGSGYGFHCFKVCVVANW